MFHKYPYTDIHELNLEWLIQKVIANVNQIEDLEAWRIKHQKEYEELSILTEDYIRNFVSIMISNNNETNIYPKIEKCLRDAFSYTDTANDAQTRNITSYINNEIINLDNKAKQYADAAEDAAIAYTDDQVFSIDSMVDPISGQLDTLSNVITHIVTYFHSDNSLTAEEYDAKQLTAGSYDARNITAQDYDFNGKNIL